MNTIQSALKSKYLLLFLLGQILSFSCKEDEPASSNQTKLVPEVSINTNGETIVNEPKITAMMIVVADSKEVYNGHIGIEYRGSTSYRLFDKKSFGIETRDATGQNLNAGFFGFPEEEDWILNGPYTDKTLLRNLLSFELSNQIGMYAPRLKLFELRINNEYMGVYEFVEKLKRHKGRIAVTKMTSTDNDPTTITGGYILKIDKTAGDTNNDDWAGDALYTENISFRSNYDQNGAPFTTPPFNDKTGSETYFLYDYPDAKDITNEQKAYIKQYINEFETALVNEDFAGATRQYENYIDALTFVDFFLLSELSHNPDAYRLSTYLYKDRDSKLKMGPIWDMNLAFGNDSDNFRSSAETWIYQYNQFIPNDGWLVPFWWEKLLRDPLFKAKVRQRWTILRAGALAKENIFKVIDDHVTILKESQAVDRNFKRWKILGVAVPFNGFVGQTYEEEIDFMKDWISRRLTWMDTEISKF